GDIITHIYHKNFSHILDENDRVVPSVFAAARRGVLFDIGFGGANFSWDVAEKAYAQGVVTDMISSDLQQLNVTGPTFSLANILTIHRRLGFSLREVIERVTSTPASALSLSDRAGSLRPGMPADVTVFRTEAGEFELLDCFNTTRTAEERIVPVMAFKDGVRCGSDLERCQDERNWFMEIIEDHIPEPVEQFSDAQRAFLGSLQEELASIEWEVVAPKLMDLEKVIALQEAVYRARERNGLSMRDALRAVYGCFIYHSFAIQVGLFLICLERSFVLERLRAVTSRAHAAA
ncbi:MAG TPA: amidohydrolase family protein, partial [Candidatus Binatia bacterium]|nr:amidohydrolase family protein [Candidatus Binatia bacterium]